MSNSRTSSFNTSGDGQAGNFQSESDNGQAGNSNQDNPTVLKQIIADLVRTRQFTKLVEEALPGLARLHQANYWDWFVLLCKQNKATGVARQALLAVERFQLEHPEPFNVDDFIADFQLSTEEVEDEAPIGQASDRDPHRLADLILESDYSYQPDPNIPTLHYWAHTWWVFNGRCYDCIEDDEFRSRVNASIEAEFKAAYQQALTAWQARRDQARSTETSFLESEPCKQPVTENLVTDVRAAILAKPGVRISAELQQPAWLYPDQSGLPDPRLIIASTDGLCNYYNLGQGTESWTEHTPRFFSGHCLPFSIKSEIATPEIDRWLDDVFEENRDLIPMYYQVGGITLSGSQEHHYIPVLQGPPRGGKGLSAMLLSAAIGERYCAAISLATLDSNFCLQKLIGKKLAVDYDARLSTNRANNPVICDRLLKLSSFNPINIDRKDIVEVSVTLPIRLVICTNPPLKFRDSVLASRLKIIPFKKSWLGREDHQLLSRLLPELPGFIRKCARAYHALVHDQRGQLVEPEAARIVREETERAAYPLKDWFETHLEADPKGRVASSHVRQSWDSWCHENRRENNHSQQAFWAEVRQLAPNIKSTAVRIGNDTMAGYAGLKFTIQPELTPETVEHATHFWGHDNRAKEYKPSSNGGN
jgi:phage/plasmid-associated DNA primase